MSSSTGLAGRLLGVALVVVLAAAMLAATALPALPVASNLMATVRTELLDETVDITSASLVPVNSFLYATDGSLIAELTFEENRDPVTLDQVPQVVIDAILATEDANFYEHAGVNHVAIIRAFLTNLAAGDIESGASTITQQYVKLAFLTPDQTYQRKLQEALYAIQVERQLTKDQILERYLNRAHFGQGTYGIATAARRYLSRDLSEVTLDQAAMLAGILRSPSNNNPISNPANARERRDIVLGQMAINGFITQDEADRASRLPLRVDISPPPVPEQPFWSDWVARLLINEDLAEALGSQTDALRAMGDTPEERRRRVFQTGLRITTTLDPRLQALAEEALVGALTRADATPEERAREIALGPMGALVSIEPGTGAIRAMAIGPHGFGSCVENDAWAGELESGQLLCDLTKVNPVVPGGGGSGRQPGSSFKPFVSAAALEAGFPAGWTIDARGPKLIPGCINPEGEEYIVRNTGGDDVLDMAGGLARSSNVYHAELTATVGPRRVADMARRLGVPVPDRDIACALGLGATDVTPLAMATGYATIVNDGEWCAPFPIERIESASGQLLWQHVPDCRQVVDPEIAAQVADFLRGPVSAGGTAPIANLGAWETRGKTGTTNDYVDAWFVGAVRQLATAAWVGFANGNRFYVDEATATEVCGDQHFLTQCPPVRQTLEDVEIAGRSYARVFGGTIPAPMWKAYMAPAVEPLEPLGFPAPPARLSGVVPDLVNAFDVEDARLRADLAGFNLRVETVLSGEPNGTRLGQDPVPGTPLELGRIVTLLVSGGPDLPATVPDLRGVTQDRAVERLAVLGYNWELIGTRIGDPTVDKPVLSQEPLPGTPLEPGAIVRLEIGVYDPALDGSVDTD
ncbi:MAG: transglycosylase domain-containing protein [Nitriliruptoraceae bacterium]